MNKMMKWWAGDTIQAITDTLFPRSARIYYMWGWFVLIWLGWMMLKALIWFWLVALVLIAQAVQLVVGLVVCAFQLVGRGFRAVRRYVAWQSSGVTTDDVEQWFSYYR